MPSWVSRTSIYWSDAEEALDDVSALATWVVRESAPQVIRSPMLRAQERLSVTSNSGKFLSIVASDEEGRNAEPAPLVIVPKSRAGLKQQMMSSQAVYADSNTFDEPWLAYTA